MSLAGFALWVFMAHPAPHWAYQETFSVDRYGSPLKAYRACFKKMASALKPVRFEYAENWHCGPVWKQE